MEGEFQINESWDFVCRRGKKVNEIENSGKLLTDIAVGTFKCHFWGEKEWQGGLCRHIRVQSRDSICDTIHELGQIAYF